MILFFNTCWFFAKEPFTDSPFYLKNCLFSVTQLCFG